MSERDWGQIPDIQNAQLQGITTIAGTPAYHLTGNVDVTRTTGDTTRRHLGPVGLYIATDTYHLLGLHGRTSVTTATTGAPAVPPDAGWIGELTYSQYNADFTIQAPTIPTPFPTPTRTPSAP